MSEFKIEKGVKAPPLLCGPYSRYPFRDMKVGDSFVVAADETAGTRVRSASRQYGLRHQMRFSVRRMPNGDWRCFRVE